MGGLGGARARGSELTDGAKTSGTDGAVHAARWGVVLSRGVVAPWDGVVSPQVFADGSVCAAMGGVGGAEMRGRGEDPGTDGAVRAARMGRGAFTGVVAPWDGVVSPQVFADGSVCAAMGGVGGAEVRGRGENLGTDGAVHAARWGVVLSRGVVAPWDGVVSPQVFAEGRAAR